MTDRTENPPHPSYGPHRVLFLHGLFRKRFDYGGRTILKIIARQIPNAAVSSMPDLLLQDGARCSRYLITPGIGNGSLNPIELVDVVYDDIIQDFDRRRSLFCKVLSSIWTCVTQCCRLVRFICGVRSKIPNHQTLRILLNASIYPAYAIVNFLLLVSIVLGCWEYVWPTVGSGENSKLPLGLAALAIIFALKNLFVNARWIERFENDSSSAFAFVECQKPESELRRTLSARVYAAIIESDESAQPREISILAYSQGALLAIDALFPANGSASPPCKEEKIRVNNLVTFGCPLPIAKRFWPNRRRNQPEHQAIVHNWINFYEKDDTLGGPLFEAIREEGIDVGVQDKEFTYSPPEGTSVWQLPHQSYWHEAMTTRCEGFRRVVTALATTKRTR